MVNSSYWFEHSNIGTGANLLGRKHNLKTLATIGRIILVFNELDRNLLWCIQLMKGLHESGNVHEVKAGLDPKYSKKIVQFFDELEGRSEYNIPSHPVRETTREDYQDALRNELISAGANRNRIAHFVESLNSESWESAGSRLKKAEGIRGVKISEYFKMSNPDLVEVSTIQQDDLDAMLLHFCALRDELIRLYFELHHSMNS